VSIFQAINDVVLSRNTWPPKTQAGVWAAIELWSAFRRSDEVRIKQQGGIPWNRRYLISPIPRMISRSKANLLYGEAPQVKAADEADQENLDRIAGQNGLAGSHASEAHRAAMISSSEREVWGRIVVDPTLLDCPIIEWVSRAHVIPHFRGRFVVGATFVTEWPIAARQTIRLLETYEAGQVTAQLWKGTPNLLGAPIALDDFEPTAGKQEVIFTGFDFPLVAFVPNSIDSDPTAGFGDYQGLEERFLAINEAATVGQENLRLAGKKRALVDAKYLRNGQLPPGDDLFVRADDSAIAGEGGKALQLIEYAFEADQLRVYLDQLIDTTLSFGGTAPQLVGRAVDGGPISGTAIKLKMIHSLMEAAGSGSYFDRAYQRLLRAAAVLDGRPTTQGGFGRRWVNPDADPAVTRGDGLPRDDQEAAQWLVLAAGADAISVEEKVRWLHPDWTSDQVDEEVKLIRSEVGLAAPTPPGPGGPQLQVPRPPGAPQLPADVPPAP
jgi:hypothetical protein